ncbi:hypothetical protein FRE64_12650 [Euhalothece natronophila Z-M001]|uniref:Uncharacterized protein n=1 Tax=Euhalothece natronophila Z-M001 TaxID=522448 RepID=A0A5B8NR81_9CHRO|nr:hypothetical protein [Euhalothece natronophila]QDZ40725.1 hypothetical protein FRE64_12650 [Euhalothece natronophila Z-M001]
MTKINLEIPNEILHKINQQGEPLEKVLVEAINNYLEQKELVKSKTWELCGSLKVSDYDTSETNYAENIDQDIY